jgi:hypothetical protein
VSPSDRNRRCPRRAVDEHESYIAETVPHAADRAQQLRAIGSVDDRYAAS